ncbi:hypothetical protein VNO80_10967 [Phaseolus coccineus]|uniref:Uncharacterized protein n=1 Tax=Phaseolus coccineus TaxID=3886 RepID=A0AAN9NEF9_PHACN
MNWRRKRNKRIDFELRDDRGRGSKRRRLLRLLLFSGSGFENVKSVADADVRRIMNYGGEKRLTVMSGRVKKREPKSAENMVGSILKQRK